MLCFDLRRWGGAILMVLGSLPASAQEVNFSATYSQVAPSVFKISSRYGTGSGFLADERGLVVTNAHVLSGTLRSVSVQMDDTTRVEGFVVAVDPVADLGVVRVNPRALGQRRPIILSPSALTVGAPVAALGYPLVRGPVLTSGRIGLVRGETVMLDMTLNPGNSGGPVLDADGRAVGVATFVYTSPPGQGLAGAVAAKGADSLLSVARARAGSDSIPPDDRLPVLSLRPFPLPVLEAAARAEKWPEKLYDVSGKSATNSFTVEFFTPLLSHRRRVRSREEGTPAEDLRQYDLDLGQYPAAVILRIIPKVGQGLGAAILNVVGAAAAGYSRSAFTPIYDPEVKGDIRGVRVTQFACDAQAAFDASGPIRREEALITLVTACRSSLVLPIQESYSTIGINGSVGDALYLLIDPSAFGPVGGGQPPFLAIQIEDGRKTGVNATDTWLVPQETTAQIWADFATWR